MFFDQFKAIHVTPDCFRIDSAIEYVLANSRRTLDKIS